MLGSGIEEMANACFSIRPSPFAHHHVHRRDSTGVLRHGGWRVVDQLSSQVRDYQVHYTY